ncbi:hypothetical protein [Entomobacter blattae]|nr:hypothetical protein [Entomobacter blattae]
MSKKLFWVRIPQVMVLSCIVFSAFGASAQAAWAPTQCGKEPEKPTLDVASVERYNASTEKFTAYEKAARSYYACALKEARQETAPIMNGMKTIHNRMTENLNGLNAKLQAAHKKLGGKK